MPALADFFRKLPQRSLFWPLTILAVILVFNALFTNNFLNIQIRDGHLSGIPIDILNRSTHIMVIAIGLTLVIATRGIDISVGSVVAISAAMTASLIGGQLVIVDGVEQYVASTPMLIAILAGLAVATLAGVWNGFLVAKLKMQPIVATLILFVAGRGVAQLITDGQIITVYYAPYFYIGNGFLLGLPFPLFIAAAVLLIALFLSRRTALGLFIQAIGSNPTASRFAGIKSTSVLIFVYAFCALCAGISGLMVSSNVKSADGNNAGLLFELDAILAVVIGGTSLAGGRFNLWGSVVGALVIQSLTTTIYAFGVPPEINLIVKALVVFIFSLVQSKDFRDFVSGASRRKRGGLGKQDSGTSTQNAGTGSGSANPAAGAKS